jgi:ABC-2 type transport system permease protein
MLPVIAGSGVLEVLSKINPVTYGIDAIRQVFLDSEVAGVIIFGHTMSIVESALLVMCVGFLLLTVAILVFNKQE